MPLNLALRSVPLNTLRQQWGPDVLVLDVTSYSAQPEWRLFSPLWPHGDIPVPFSPGTYSASVEGVWQGLKVLQAPDGVAILDIDPSKFEVTTMRHLKRRGHVLGHRVGIHGDLAHLLYCFRNGMVC